MELQEFVRKPFPVNAVQVDFANAYEVADWCKGRVELKKTRLMGGAGKGEMDLPTVVFNGTGDYRDKEFVAGLGDWVVELRGNFRVFKKAQFRATFDPAPKKNVVEAIVDGEKTKICRQHGTTVEDCVKQDHESEEVFINPGDSTEEIARKLGFEPTDYCIDHNCAFAECNSEHLENAAQADQEYEDAAHNAGQL